MIRLILESSCYGLSNAAIYLMIALGLTLLFGAMRIFFFAHGAIYMMGAMLLHYFVVSLRLGHLLSIFIVIFFLALFGIIVEISIYNRVSHSAEAGFIAFLGLAIILESVMCLIFGPHDMQVPTMFPGIVKILGMNISLERLVVIPVCAICVILLWLFLYKTKIGKALRAIEQSREIASILGINPGRISMVIFAIAFILVALAGVMVAPIYIVNPIMGQAPLSKAFIIIILGGLGSISGAILASIIVGIAESIISTFLGVSPSLLAIFLLIMVILIWRPRGLLGVGEV